MTQLFSPATFRDLTLKNRLVVAPMCQYSAIDGMANDWHFAHLARFAIGGFGLVIVEATGVQADGRISYADLGLWNDDQIAPLARIVDFLHGQGTAAGIQLAHAGRKASTPVPTRPNPKESEKQDIGFHDWQPVAPSPVIHSETAPGFKIPTEMSIEAIEKFKADFLAAVHRAERAGFDLIEIHDAHGYLINQFLSPLANKRTDNYGGSLENRMRLLLELSAEVRAAWPASKPLFVRISASDNHPEGITIEDSVIIADRLKAVGIDAIHVSSGGFDGAAFKPEPLYQVPLSAEIRARTGIPTIAVGLITRPEEAETIIEKVEADLVALARAALDDPNWPLHAQLALEPSAEAYEAWPRQADFAVKNMDRSLHQRGFALK